MRKIFFLILSYLIVYVCFLFIELQYVWIVKKDINLFLREDTFKEPVFYSILVTTLTILSAYITKNK